MVLYPRLEFAQGNQIFWDELFLIWLCRVRSLASCLTLSSESGGHRRLSSDVHMSFPRGVFIRLETATVTSVNVWMGIEPVAANDLFDLLLGRAICCLGMGGARPASFVHRRDSRCPRRRGAARRCVCLEVPRLERFGQWPGAVVRRG